MRYALLICGQPRTMEFCYPSLKRHILDVYQPDVFLVSDEQPGRMQELFNPKQMQICSQEYIDEQVRAMRLGYHNTPNDGLVAKDLSIAWKLWHANRMKRVEEVEEGFRYDTVMLTRFDVKFHKVPAVGQAAENVIYVPRVGAYWETPPDEPGIHWHGYSAHLCWMSSQVADQIAGIYFEGEDNFKIASQVADWGYIPEHVLKNYCDRNGIRAQFVDIEMMLIRGTSEEPLSYHYCPLSEYPEYA